MLSASLLLIGCKESGAETAANSESALQKTDAPIDIPPPTPEQQRAIDDMHERNKYRAMPDCEGEFINLNMGPIKLKAPRTLAYIRLKTGKDIDPDRPSPEYNCEENLENVSGFGWSGYSIWLDKSGFPENPRTSYASLMRLIKGHTIQKMIRPDGVTRLFIKDTYVEHFILPLDKSPTANGDPVLYSCVPWPENRKKDRKPSPSIKCETSYYHPSGLRVLIRFPREKDMTDRILEEDRKWRNLLEDMIVENNYVFEEEKVPSDEPEQKLEIPPPTPEQQRAIDEMHERDRYRAMPKCEGEFINLDMGLIKLKAPRTLAYVRLGTREKIDPDRPSLNYNCEENLENVSSFGWTDYNIWLDKKTFPEDYILTSYASLMHFYELRGYTPQKTVRPDGVTRLFIKDTYVEHFILPLDKSPTANGDPVLYSCGVWPESMAEGRKRFPGISCETSYYHPSGLRVRIRFPREKGQTDRILEEDQKWRKLLEDMIIENNYVFEKGKTP